eukprot:GILI01004414.1.p1 GENE.GILI01004414.1~~GILI01004414.1.p1  ORF type:complete len:324 (-),score=119.31 GILI01004414.1:222-1145(-)
MFEASVSQASIWKKVIDTMKDLVNEANFDCSPAGVTIQAMDSSHVALVHLLLHFDGFRKYQCERSNLMGINMGALSKVLKIVDNNDQLTLRHEDDSDILVISTMNTDTSKLCEYQLKLMDIESESLGIPEMEYRNKVSLPSGEFAKICRDMGVFGDTVTVSVDKQGVKFTAAGDIGEGYAFIRAGPAPVKKEKSATKVKGEVKGEIVKGEIVKGEKVKAERIEEDEDDNMTIAAATQKQPDEAGVIVDVEEPITLSFALRFFNIFGKGSTLNDRVTLHFAKDSPCLIEYRLEAMGYLRFYLAPKLDE